MTRVLILAGGVVAAGSRDRLPEHDLVVAADSGLHHAAHLGVHVDVAIGDFDSVDPTALARAEVEGVALIRHPATKDATDLELALDHAMEVGATSITVMGGGGGRLDHLVGSLFLIASARYRSVPIRMIDGLATITVVHERADILGDVGDYLSLLPFGADASGVSTEGLLYPLSKETLFAGSTRGVSNEVCSSKVSVALSHGTLLVVQPDPHDA